MLLRIWTTAVRAEREQQYLGYARTRSREMFLAHAACLGVFFLRRVDGRHAVCSLWRDAAAIAALSDSALYQSTVRGLAATGALDGEATVEVFEVTGGAVTVDLAAALVTATSARSDPRT